MFRISDAHYPPPTQAAVDMRVELAVAHITRYRRNRSLLGQKAGRTSIGLAVIIGSAGLISLVLHARRISPVEVVISRADRIAPAPLLIAAPVPIARDVARGTERVSRHRRAPRAPRPVRSEPEVATASPAIAEPLAGEALQQALTEDHQRTRELNAAVLESMTPQ